MTEKEKAPLISRGLASPDFLHNMQISESASFRGTNAGSWTQSDVRRIKHLLAWHGVLPLFPKRIEIQPEETEWASAYYKWTGLRQKSVSFVRWNGVWRITGSHGARACGLEATNFWDKAVSRIPIDFSNE
jgi:hypothetical protein